AANAVHSRSLSAGSPDASPASAGTRRSRTSSRRTERSHSPSATARCATGAGMALHTFTPTPTDSHCRASPCQRPSHRMPASLRSPSNTSLGHLRRVSNRPRRASTASATASPTRTEITPSSARTGRSSMPSQTPPADDPVVRRERVEAAALEQHHEKPNGPDPAGKREHEAHRQRKRSDGRDVHRHVTPLQDRGTRDHRNRQQEAELRGGGGSEAAPQGSAHGRPGTGDSAEHSRHGLREPDPHGDPDRRFGADAAEPPRGPVHEPRDRKSTRLN